MTSSECIAEGHFAVPMICEDVREVLEKLLTWSEVHWGTPRSMLKFVSVLFCCCCCCFGGFSGFEWRFCLPVQCLLLWRNSHIINVHIICFLKHIRFLVLQALTLSIRGVLRTVHLFCYELAWPPPPTPIGITDLFCPPVNLLNDTIICVQSMNLLDIQLNHWIIKFGVFSL